MVQIYLAYAPRSRILGFAMNNDTQNLEMEILLRRALSVMPEVHQLGVGGWKLLKPDLTDGATLVAQDIRAFLDARRLETNKSETLANPQNKIYP